ncbi:acyl-CoA dehydrogenase family protein [Pseudonocardia terrae]|uniref:acyl-CoA dehydrogenase family protein n=1 Tax=Pseudonocardia terrae TaxID=2905831 RepID=UPI003556E3C3
MDTADFEAMLAAVRDFVRKEVVPAEDEIERTDEIPATIRRAAADMGLFGYALPEEYGGLGFTLTEDARLAIEVGYTSPGFRSMFGTNNGIAGQALVALGTEEQKKDYLPRMASGELVASFALTEAEAGSDPSGLRTRAVRDGDEYVITGEKRFITNADKAGVFMTFARTGAEGTGTQGISLFTVDAGLPGLRVGPTDAKMGQRGAHTAEVSFSEVRVPASALVGGVEGAGFGTAMRTLSRGRLHISGLAVGMAERLLEEMVAHAAATKQGGRPIGEFQQVQAMIADSYTELYAGRAMLLAAAAEYDAGGDRRKLPSTAKLFCTEMVGRVADRAVQVHGGMGYMRGVVAERLYRDARLYRIYEGTSEIQKVIIAKRLLAEAG